MIYNQTFKVPVWVIVNTDAESTKYIVNEFKEMDAKHIDWPATSFPITIAELAGKGWSHEVNKPFPMFVSVDFLMFAISKHLDKKFGPTKRLSGSASKPYSSLDRKIESGDDYVRLFNDVLELEDETSLSHLFDIAKLCVQNREKARVFITTGPVSEKLLQKVAEKVITIGASGSSVVATDRNVTEVATESIQLVASLLGINK